MRLPGGDRLTGPRLRGFGPLLGMGPGAERLHYILELPPDSAAFLYDVENALDFARNPLYAVIHEACYADGCATRWSAERLLPGRPIADPSSSPASTSIRGCSPTTPRSRRCAKPPRLLAEREWPRLYDPEQLARNEVPAAAAVYAGDMYVERAFSEETAAQIRGLRVGHQRVRARRPARRRRAHPRAADRSRPRDRSSALDRSTTLGLMSDADQTTVQPFSGRTAWARNLETPLRNFLRTETGSAAFLLAATVAALVWVNVDAASYDSVWNTTLSIRVGAASVALDLRHWVNTGLMTFFFFVVGLEARREFDMGELRERRRVALPLAAGLGGMVVPVAIYLAINAGSAVGARLGRGDVDRHGVRARRCSRSSGRASRTGCARSCSPSSSSTTSSRWS